MLTALDLLENHPTYYLRKQLPIAIEASAECFPDTVINCWTYLLHNFKPSLLTLPYFDCYSSKGTHGLPYVEKDKRSGHNTYIEVKVAEN